MHTDPLNIVLDKVEELRDQFILIKNKSDKNKVNNELIEQIITYIFLIDKLVNVGLTKLYNEKPIHVFSKEEVIKLNNLEMPLQNFELSPEIQEQHKSELKQFLKTRGELITKLVSKLASVEPLIITLENNLA